MNNRDLPVLAVEQDIQSIPLTEEVIQSLGLKIATTNINYVVNCNTVMPVANSEPPQVLLDGEKSILLGNNQTVMCQVLYPEDLNINLEPVYNKRGRPKTKKKKLEKEKSPEPLPMKTTRTRSGRLIKVPRHMEKDFEKIELTNEPEVTTTEFTQPEVADKAPKIELKELQHHQRKRTIAAHFKCPKCHKLYLGKSKMLQHLQKNPDHGPLPEQKKELHFDLWNYLVDITQKCSPAQRGLKFSEELKNLLHNLRLLASALFKEAAEVKTSVQVDKVLGCALGLPPGQYKFQDSELYKDVTVWKLFNNTDFFKPSPNSDNYDVGENKENKRDYVCSEGDSACHTPMKDSEMVVDDDKGSLGNDQLGDKHLNVKDITTFNSPQLDPAKASNIFDSKAKAESASEIFKPPLDHRIDSDLLTDNLLLHAIPTIRTSVDELLSAVDSGSGLMDNSASSDEVMNVDQFVNERFKKITEPEAELSGASLNLELPSLDLFQFHNS